VPGKDLAYPTGKKATIEHNAQFLELPNQPSTDPGDVPSTEAEVESRRVPLLKSGGAS
jgi:hypothetical protein